MPIVKYVHPFFKILQIYFARGCILFYCHVFPNGNTFCCIEIYLKRRKSNNYKNKYTTVYSTLIKTLIKKQTYETEKFKT